MDLHESYENQRRMAKHRGIEWLFTYKTWCEWWLATGKLHLRGNTKEKPYMMCRIGDKGPYSSDNVYCGTVSNNNQDGWDNHPDREPVGFCAMQEDLHREVSMRGGLKSNSIRPQGLAADEVARRLDKISHIDLTRIGWVNKVAEALSMTHTQARRFVNKHYKGETYKRNSPAD